MEIFSKELIQNSLRQGDDWLKYTIHGFSQEKGYELKLGLKEFLILRWFVDFQATKVMSQKEINGEMYHWVDYKAILDDLPMLHVTNKRVVERIFRNLVNAKVLKHKTVKQGGTYSFFKLGDKYTELLTSTNIINENEIETEKPDTKITMKKGKGEKAPKELKNLYMEFVELTQEQYDKLVADYTEAKAKEMISRVNNYIGSTGKKYKSHYHTILNWLNKDGIKPVSKAETPSSSGLKIDENGNLIRG